MITQANIWASQKDLALNNVLPLVNAGAPVNGVTGAGIAGPGTSLIDSVNSVRYINIGTMASPVWVNIGRQVIGTISAADIVATGVGKFGHANGVVMLAAQGALTTIEIESVIINYRFAVAAYTAGGNITANWGAGGAALTGLVSAANSVGAASSKDVMLVPLATVGVPLVRNASINLVSSAAFTQPGTAAGVINWTLNYRVHNLDMA